MTSFLTRRDATPRPRRSDCLSSVTVTTQRLEELAAAPASPGDWDRMHMTLAAWKARSLLTEAVGHLQDAIPADESHDPLFEAEFFAAIDSTRAIIERLQSVTARTDPPPRPQRATS